MKYTQYISDFPECNYEVTSLILTLFLHLSYFPSSSSALINAILYCSKVTQQCYYWLLTFLLHSFCSLATPLLLHLSFSSLALGHCWHWAVSAERERELWEFLILAEIGTEKVAWEWKHHCTHTSTHTLFLLPLIILLLDLSDSGGFIGKVKKQNYI